MGSSSPAVPPIIPAPVKSPALLPPTTPPTPTYYQMPTTPQNIQYQYFPAGHNVPVIQHQQLPWNPVNMQTAIPMQMANQSYISAPPQFSQMPVGAPNYENGSAIMQSPPFMWTANTNPSSAPYPYTMQQSHVNNPPIANTAVPSNNVSYVNYQQSQQHQSYAAQTTVSSQHQHLHQQMSNSVIAMQSTVPKTLDHQQSSNSYHIQPR